MENVYFSGRRGPGSSVRVMLHFGPKAEELRPVPNPITPPWVDFDWPGPSQGSYALAYTLMDWCYGDLDQVHELADMFEFLVVGAMHRHAWTLTVEEIVAWIGRDNVADALHVKRNGKAVNS